MNNPCLSIALYNEVGLYHPCV